jgi:hypothetical protein
MIDAAEKTAANAATMTIVKRRMRGLISFEFGCRSDRW